VDSSPQIFWATAAKLIGCEIVGGARIYGPSPSYNPMAIMMGHGIVADF